MPARRFTFTPEANEARRGQNAECAGDDSITLSDGEVSGLSERAACRYRRGLKTTTDSGGRVTIIDAGRPWLSLGSA
jgi:hypothetical protein